MEELRECPCCGSVAHMGAPNMHGMTHILCPSCGLESAWGTPAKVISLWNRRPSPENKALTLENGFDITNADGTPINYDALGRKYKDKLCYCDIDGFYIGEDGQLVLMDDCGASVPVDRGDYRIEAHKPEED